METEEELKTIKNYAKLKKVTPAHIYKLIKESRITPFVIDGVYFIDLSKYPTSIKNYGNYIRVKTILKNNPPLRSNK